MDAVLRSFVRRGIICAPETHSLRGVEEYLIFLITTALPSMWAIEVLVNVEETCSPYLGDHFRAYIGGEPSHQNPLVSRHVSVEEVDELAAAVSIVVSRSLIGLVRCGQPPRTERLISHVHIHTSTILDLASSSHNMYGK